MREFKIRCSAIGEIMVGNMGLTDSQESELQTLLNKEKALTAIQSNRVAELQIKKANPELPKGVQTYCLGWIKEQLYQRQREFKSKYTQKGNEVEADSIKFIGEWLGYSDFDFETGQFAKNETYFENDFMTGTPDVLPTQSDTVIDMVIDAKNSWDCFSFPLFDNSIPDMGYWWQGQGYMELTGRKNYKIAYTLMNTPEGLIESEMRKFAYANGLDPDEMDYSEWYEKMSYDNISSLLKIKTFDFEKDGNAIEEIIVRVIECRKFINGVLAGLPPAIKEIYDINF